MPSSAPSLQLTLPRVSEGWWPPGGLVQAPLTWYCEASPTFPPWSRLRAGCPCYRWPGPATLRGCGDLRGPGPGRGAAAPSSSPHPRTCGLTLTIWSASRPGIGQGSSNFFFSVCCILLFQISAATVTNYSISGSACPHTAEEAAGQCWYECWCHCVCYDGIARLDHALTASTPQHSPINLDCSPPLTVDTWIIKCYFLKSVLLFEILI